MAWSDNYNSIYVNELAINDIFTWQFRVEEHKKRGTLHISARLFKKTDSYDGPTKNGFIQQIETEEDIDKLETAFTNLFKAAREKL